MYLLGHVAIGYLVGKAASEVLQTDLNLYTLLTLSLLPDVDLLIPLLPHRGPTHSIDVALLIVFLFLIVVGKTRIPYGLALASHAALGDLITGNVKLLWPIRTQCYTYIGIDIFSVTNLVIETALLAVAIVVLYRTGEHHVLFRVPRVADLVRR